MSGRGLGLLGHSAAPAAVAADSHGATIYLGPVEIGPIVLASMLLFGYRKLPDALRSLSRSVRIRHAETEEARERPRFAQD